MDNTGKNKCWKPDYEQLLQAYKIACREMVEVGTCCPFDARSWKGCMEDDCENKYAECWERYFLEKAKEG